MAFETTSLRLWKRLSREEKLAAATHFWNEPPSALVPTALAALVAARKLRPQAARALPPDQQAKILASVHDPGEPLSGFLLASLHLGDRRPILRAFLDAAGLPHEDGMLKPESDDMALDKDKVQGAVQKIAAEFPREQVELYLNTLWLQDPDRWALLEHSADWLPAAKS
jgi:hypothetical protein